MGSTTGPTPSGLPPPKNPPPQPATQSVLVPVSSHPHPRFWHRIGNALLTPIAWAFGLAIGIDQTER